MRVLRIGGGKSRQGHLLVETRATVSVCRPGTFKAAVDPEQNKKLHSVDDMLLDTKGVTEPVLELGDHNRQTARTTFQVVEGITDDIFRSTGPWMRVLKWFSTSHARTSSGKMDL